MREQLLRGLTIRDMCRQELGRLTKGKTLSRAEINLAAQVARLNVAERIAPREISGPR